MTMHLVIDLEVLALNIMEHYHLMPVYTTRSNGCILNCVAKTHHTNCSSIFYYHYICHYIFFLFPPVSQLAKIPSPVRNFMVNTIFNTSRNKVIARLSWIGPERPYGKIDQYNIVLSSPESSQIRSTILDIKVSNGIHISGNHFTTHWYNNIHDYLSIFYVQDTAPAQDMRMPVETDIVFSLRSDEYFQFSVSVLTPSCHQGLAFTLLSPFQPQVRGVSEWGIEGELAVETVPNALAQSPTNPSIIINDNYLYGIIVGIAVLVVVFVIIVGVIGYHCYKRNKALKTKVGTSIGGLQQQGITCRCLPIVPIR